MNTVGVGAGMKALFLSLFALGFALVAVAPAEGQRNRRGDDERSAEERAEDRVFSQRVGEVMLRAQEALTAEDFPTALRELNRAYELDPSPYEAGVILQIRGQTKFFLDDVNGAISDWQIALRDGDLTEEESANLEFNIGQLYLAEGQYQSALNILIPWIDRYPERVTAQALLNIVAAYASLEPPDYRAALPYGRRAYELANPRERVHYDTLNFLFAENGLTEERAALLQEMVQLFPTDKTIWNSIAALYAQGATEAEQRGDDREFERLLGQAFEVRKIMYLNGMLTSESEIQFVVDYYSFFDVPIRGAEILAQEMARGRIEQTQRNFEKLARLYRQAREWDSAIDPQTRAAELSGDGILFRQLGEALYARSEPGDLARAEEAFQRALQAGGLDDPGEVWVLIANTRYEREDRDGAVRAFREALNTARRASTRRSAQGWLDFIDGEIEAQRRREEFERKVRADEIRVACERRARGTQIIDTALEGVDCDQVLRDAGVDLSELGIIADDEPEAEAPAEDAAAEENGPAEEG